MTYSTTSTEEVGHTTEVMGDVEHQHMGVARDAAFGVPSDILDDRVDIENHVVDIEDHDYEHPKTAPPKHLPGSGASSPILHPASLHQYLPESLYATQKTPYR